MVLELSQSVSRQLDITEEPLVKYLLSQERVNNLIHQFNVN